jgi:hypothetical protein
MPTTHPHYQHPQHRHGADDRLLTIEEVAELTRICVATPRWMRHTGTGPHSWIDDRYSSEGRPA